MLRDLSKPTGIGNTLSVNSFMMHVGKFQNQCRQNKEMFAVFRLFTFSIPVIQMLPKISNWASVGLNSREGG